jgi:hypothetical protein
VKNYAPHLRGELQRGARKIFCALAKNLSMMRARVSRGDSNYPYFSDITFTSRVTRTRACRGEKFSRASGAAIAGCARRGGARVDAHSLRLTESRFFKLCGSNRMCSAGRFPTALTDTRHDLHG